MSRFSDWVEITGTSGGERRIHVKRRGASLLRYGVTNRGTAFTNAEREALGLQGLLPPIVDSLEGQMVRVYRNYTKEPSDLHKYQFLRSLQERNEVLFFALLEKHLEEMMPIVYTPTVGAAVQRWGEIYQQTRGLSFSLENIGMAPSIAANHPWDDVRMIVATDSSAILGIGDQGYGGLAIPIGKLALYTVGGGVSPFETLPISLDVGTDRRELRDDPFYLGTRRERLKGEEYLAFMDAFVRAIKTRFPRAILQWEDLSKDAAFTVLDRYRKELPSFNDDIQGTGAVALAGVLSACKAKGERLRDQTFVILGAGAGGGGVAWTIWKGLVADGLDEESARKRIFTLDSKGLVTLDRTNEEHKRRFAQPKEVTASWKTKGPVADLLETVTGSKATVLLGLSGQPGAFDRASVEAMAANTARPMIFPLSNPTSACEATPADILAWTGGRAIVATGSPFEPVMVDGKKVVIGQGNNAFIFPGLGLGAIVAEAREVTDGMVLAAAAALARVTEERYLAAGLVYPPVGDLRSVSVEVAVDVVLEACRENVAGARVHSREEARARVLGSMWAPSYLPIEAD
ncbi:MAG: NAD-dependent malic enzyme [Polyangiaceae bacterium]